MSSEYVKLPQCLQLTVETIKAKKSAIYLAFFLQRVAGVFSPPLFKSNSVHKLPHNITVFMTCAMVDDQESTVHHEKKVDLSTSFKANKITSAGEEKPVTGKFHYAAGPQPNSLNDASLNEVRSKHVNINHGQQRPMPTPINNDINDNGDALGEGFPDTKPSPEIHMDNPRWGRPSAPASWPPTPVVNPAPPRSSSGESSLRPSHAELDNFGRRYHRRYIADNFRSVFENLRSLCHALETHAISTQAGLQSVNTNIDNLSRERHRADADAERFREIIDRRVTDLIDWNYLQWLHSKLLCADQSASRKVLDSINCRMNSLVDLVTEDLENDPEDRARHCQCAPPARNGPPKRASSASESSPRIIAETMRTEVDGRLLVDHNRILDFQQGRPSRTCQTARRGCGGGLARCRRPDGPSVGLERFGLGGGGIDHGGIRRELQENIGRND